MKAAAFRCAGSKGTATGRLNPPLYRERTSAARASSLAVLLRLPVVMEMRRGRLGADWLPTRLVGGAST